MASVLPLNVFPGFTAHGIVSDQVREIATVFNAEGIEALQGIPESAVAWADLGSRYTPGLIDVKVPVRLTSLLGFEPFEGERHYHQVTVAAVNVRPAPWSLGLEWPIQINESGIPMLQNFYGVSGIAGDVVSHGRALKADLMASLVMAGMTNASLGMTATALTIPQPGVAAGLPLFSDGATSGSTQHYANPLDVRSTQFSNLHLNVGTFDDYFGQSLVDMTRVPHPSKANMTLGLGVTDVVGGTNMLLPFWRTAISTLSLQTASVGGTPLSAAPTNIYNPKLIEQAGAQQLVGTSGLAPWRFWIAPQLDAHPYLVANPTKHMWLSISQTRKGAAWAELAGPNATFAPRITLLGDGSEEALKSRKVRLFGDLDAGAAAGLPHFVKLYTETTP